MDRLQLEEIIKWSLIEDIGEGDHTSQAIIDSQAMGNTALYVKETGIIAGISFARQLIHYYDPTISINLLKTDGDVVVPGDIVFNLYGKQQSMLAVERVLLNFMQRMSGIATTTRKMVDKISHTKAKLLDTRKTTPLLRELEKEAVRLGGGFNHRFGLYDMILIKDNHIDFAGGVSQAITKVEKYLIEKKLTLPIEVEARNIENVKEILQFDSVFRIMLDNFNLNDIKTAVAIVNGKKEIEVSGGINLNNIKDYAETGVDYISSGYMTHHYSSLDLSLKVTKTN
ncbi:MAG TPA: carboxylating nicotinate-nucleotide diphosphorylase [Bacteroidales bacterium]|jgi:nicotinate-nucleotide pyrophosphorylase (carboxylating)|nr:carboxylating nicotinate-nucleotide diphosphorylase [Bacteroidales bacterium]MBP8946264.1 carboxylating nicotinate-nucleotide diphosphorylase [Bacteroidales bacterium]HCM29944.1 carboxylating nicotinate-nucleotide diphosphorylase [Bacteroidales bacterium]HNW20519.1 carboxylating nicotinate-nucleotide diphosphorylase [Bacteroidales bacterium]HOC39964.1 carboxylating nicotinate-nucleotide diphosphorylase [Bacteroidales bacterium]